jgi:hypothetical protein
MKPVVCLLVERKPGKDSNSLTSPITVATHKEEIKPLLIGEDRELFP